MLIILGINYFLVIDLLRLKYFIVKLLLCIDCDYLNLRYLF